MPDQNNRHRRRSQEHERDGEVVPITMLNAEVHWYPGDGNPDPEMDDDGPGWVAFARLSDGTLAYPMSHPSPRRTRDEAVALLDRVVCDDNGAVYIRWPE